MEPSDPGQADDVLPKAPPAPSPREGSPGPGAGAASGEVTGQAKEPAAGATNPTDAPEPPDPTGAPDPTDPTDAADPTDAPDPTGAPDPTDAADPTVDPDSPGAAGSTDDPEPAGPKPVEPPAPGLQEPADEAVAAPEQPSGGSGAADLPGPAASPPASAPERVLPPRPTDDAGAGALPFPADGSAPSWFPREPTLEVQLGYAGTLMAIGTALVWFVLDTLRSTGVNEFTDLLLILIGCTLLQMLVLDLTWFVAVRGIWIAAELRGRADPRNEADPRFQAELHALEEAGSRRFYLGMYHAMQGSLWLLAAVGLWSAVTTDGALLLRLLFITLALPGPALALNRALTPRSRRWRTHVHPRVQGMLGFLGLRWVDPSHGMLRFSLLQATGRRFLALVLVLVNLVYVLVSSLQVEQEVYRRSEGGDVVVRFHLGGLKPRTSSVDVRFSSPTVPDALLSEGTHWMGDGILLVLPVSELEPGTHTLQMDRLTVQTGTSNLDLAAPLPTRFVVVDR